MKRIAAVELWPDFMNIEKRERLEYKTDLELGDKNTFLKTLIENASFRYVRGQLRSYSPVKLSLCEWLDQKDAPNLVGLSQYGRTCIYEIELNEFLNRKNGDDKTKIATCNSNCYLTGDSDVICVVVSLNLVYEGRYRFAEDNYVYETALYKYGDEVEYGSEKFKVVSIHRGGFADTPPFLMLCNIKGEKGEVKENIPARHLKPVQSKLLGVFRINTEQS